MFNYVKNSLSKLIKSRLIVLVVLFALLAGILIQRLYTMQIINGEKYLTDFTMQIKKETTLKSTRGNIYDRDGNAVAYNKLAYNVTYEDVGSYDTTRERNLAMNGSLYQIMKVIEDGGDQVYTNYAIDIGSDGQYEFTREGFNLLRFRADIFGYADTEDLKTDERNCTAEEMMQTLSTKKWYGIDLSVYTEEELQEYGLPSSFTKEEQLKLTALRSAVAQNSYQKFVLTVLATGVSDETVAWVSENSDTLQGMSVNEETVRKYNDSKYFAHIIGYTGQISVDEYKELSKKDKSYSLTDVVGKSGIEQVMDKELQGEKGYEKISVDNLGKVVDVIKRKEPTAGNDVYLSIDADLTKAVYDLLEQEIAGIVYSKIENIKEYHSTGSASDIKIPIDDVYFAFINNGMIDTSHFTEDDASDTERTVYSAYTSKESSVLSRMDSLLSGSANTPFGELGEEDQDYITELIKRLKSNGVLDNSAIDTSDGTYVNWKEGKISLNEYLNYAISKSWIDISKFTVEEKYSDSEEIFQSLTAYILDDLKEDYNFSKIVYKYMIRQNMITALSDPL